MTSVLLNHIIHEWGPQMSWPDKKIIVQVSKSSLCSDQSARQSQAIPASLPACSRRYKATSNKAKPWTIMSSIKKIISLQDVTAICVRKGPTIHLVVAQRMSATGVRFSVLGVPSTVNGRKLEPQQILFMDFAERASVKVCKNPCPPFHLSCCVSYTVLGEKIRIALLVFPD